MTFTVLPMANADAMEAAAWNVLRKRYSAAAAARRGRARARADSSRPPARTPPAEDGPPGGEFRNYLTRRYGYRIVFEVTPTEVIVFAVVRCARRPGFWLARRTDPNPPEQP